MTITGLTHSFILSFRSMEKEIADCLIRGDTPILPPESFLEEEKPEQGMEEEPEAVLRRTVCMEQMDLDICLPDWRLQWQQL